MCSLEITFVTALKITSSGNFQYKTQKLLISFSAASNGAITTQNTGATPPSGGFITGSGHDIRTLTSTAVTHIGVGFLTSNALNSISIYQQVGIPNIPPGPNYRATVVIDYKLTVNHHQL